MPKANGHEKKVSEAKARAEGAGKDGYLWTVRTKYRILGRGETEEIPEGCKAEDKMIRVGIFKTTPAVARVHKGLTVNLGNFESARVDVGADIPCYVEEFKEIDALANTMVEETIQREVLEIRGKDIRPGYEQKRQEAQAAPPAPATAPTPAPAPAQVTGAEGGST
jgi:hypothetical protein